MKMPEAASHFAPDCRMPVEPIVAVVQEHVEEAASLRERRTRLVCAPHARLDPIRPIADRTLGNGGEESLASAQLRAALLEFEDVGVVVAHLSEQLVPHRPFAIESPAS